MTFADPAATPVTRPVDETVATAPLSVDQTNGMSLVRRPLLLYAYAMSCDVFPAARLRFAGVRVIFDGTAPELKIESATSGFRDVGWGLSPHAEVASISVVD
jgi:hypothetical protein